MNNLGFATSFGLNTNPNAAKNAELANVFGDSDSGEEAPQAPQDVVRFQLEQQRKKVEAQMARQAAEVTKKDPTVFEYDEVFDHMKKKDEVYQEQKQLKQSIRGKPKYVDKLIREAEKRKHQNDLWYEKKLQRELEAEKAAFGETEKFVTPSYKKHLEELKMFEEKQKREEEADEAARQKGGMQGFYSNMLGFATGQVGKSPPTQTDSTIAEEPAVKKRAVESANAEQTAPFSTLSAPASDAKPALTEAEQKEEARILALNLSNAVGAKEVDEEQRLQQLQELNKSAVTEDRVQSARERYLARKRAAAANE